jgi:hypothetical protein
VLSGLCASAILTHPQNQESSKILAIAAICDPLPPIPNASVPSTELVLFRRSFPFSVPFAPVQTLNVLGLDASLPFGASFRPQKSSKMPAIAAICDPLPPIPNATVPATISTA